LTDEVKNAVFTASESVTVSDLVFHGSWTPPSEMRSLRLSPDRIVECLTHGNDKGQLVTNAEQCGKGLRCAQSCLSEPSLPVDARKKLKRKHDALLIELNEQLASISFSPTFSSVCPVVFVLLYLCVSFLIF